MTVSCALFALPALADFTLVNEAVVQGKAKEVTLSARGGKTYFEFKEDGAPAKALLRDAAAHKMYVVDHATKTVLVISDEDSQQLEAQQAQFKAQLKAQLDKLPPEQRARIEASMLGETATHTPAVKVTFERKKSSARKVGPFSCADYLIKRDGQLIGEGCFAAWKSLGVNADEMKAALLTALPKTQGNLNPVSQAFDAHADAPGFPVWRKHVDEQGQVTVETTLKSLSKTALPEATFEVPSTYTHKSMGDTFKRHAAPPRTEP